MQEHRYDVLIVGAGGAGMRAAIEAAPRARTAVLTKLYPTRSHTGAAQGGMCAALANVEEDNWEWHTFDTVKGGDYIVDQDAAEIMAKEAMERQGISRDLKVFATDIDRDAIVTASTGQAPLAVSAESITASAPS